MNKPAILGGKPGFHSPIKLVDITFSSQKDVLSQIHETLESSLLTNQGKHLAQFEQSLQSVLGVPVAAVANATLGLILTLQSAQLQGKVIVPSFTFCATSHSVVWAGLQPSFVDVDPESFTIDPTAVEDAIDDSTSAIMGVHTFGNPCDIDALQKIARKHHLKLFFDAAHAFGSLYHSKPIGQFGDAEVFSTHATKTLVTGEGGFVCSHDKNLLTHIRRARNFGFTEDNSDILFCGTNAKMTEIGAILGLDTLHSINPALKQRARVAALFERRLGKLPGLRFQKVTDDSFHSHCFFGMLVIPEEFGINRDQLSAALAAEHITTRKYFYPPLHKTTAYNRFKNLSLPHTDFISEHILCLPIHSKVTVEVAEQMCDVIDNIHAHASAIARAFHG